MLLTCVPTVQQLKRSCSLKRFTSVLCLSQEEIAIFIEEIIVYIDHIEILTKTGNKKTVAIDKLK